MNPEYYTNKHEAQDAYNAHRKIDGMRSISLLTNNDSDWVICRNSEVADFIAQGYSEVAHYKN